MDPNEVGISEEWPQKKKDRIRPLKYAETTVTITDEASGRPMTKKVEIKAIGPNRQQRLGTRKRTHKFAKYYIQRVVVKDKLEEKLKTLTKNKKTTKYTRLSKKKKDEYNAELKALAKKIGKLRALIDEIKGETGYSVEKNPPAPQEAILTKEQRVERNTKVRKENRQKQKSLNRQLTLDKEERTIVDLENFKTNRGL